MTTTDSIVLGSSRPDLIHDETIADLFRASAKKFSAKTAIIFNDRSLTYEELDKWSDAIAIFLKGKGIGRAIR